MYELHSRICRLFPPWPPSLGPHASPSMRKDFEIFVLRDDELGGFWGSKYRKYSSIIEHCRQLNISHIIATGGINSNNLAASAYLATGAGLKVHAFAIQDHVQESASLTGNRFLLRLALPPEQLYLVDRADKNSVGEQMQKLAERLNFSGQKSLILEEGGGCEAAIPGCLTLVDELTRARPDWPLGIRPDHVFIDSGTGLTAGALAAGIHLDGLGPKIKLHIVQMAGFEEQMALAFDKWITPKTSIKWQDVQNFTRVYRPLAPRSYGATSQNLFDFIKWMTRNHGILTDPVYSAKLFMRAFDLMIGQNCRGRILIVHTGGISGLLGYSSDHFKFE